MFNTNLQNLNLDDILKELVSVKERRFFNIVSADILTEESTLKLPIKLDQQCFDFMFK
jgi:hypothetical protein